MSLRRLSISRQASSMPNPQSEQLAHQVAVETGIFMYLYKDTHLCIYIHV
jgi:hypothetical protein